MEIIQEAAPAIRPAKSDSDAESVMGVKLTPQLYRMLSAGIYQNNVRAILREYLCNAYDAQVEAGNPDAEIQLYLPNTIEPTFKLRDFGTGLSEDGVRNIFGSYGNSTKTKTNDQIGCFGIGSKAAFSYTDQFMVVSYYKDTKRTYTCFLEDGMPKIRLMAEEDTEEPNGLEISFPVMEPLDYRRFHQEAMHVLKPFKDKGINVKVFSSLPTEVKDYKRDVEGENWFTSRDIRSGTGLVVRMGLVDYWVDVSQLNLGHNLRSVVQHGVLLRMPMGSVQPTPSRENLQMDEVTRRALENALDPINAEVVNRVHTQIDGCETIAAARQLCYDLLGTYHSPFYNFRMQIRPTWKGRPLHIDLLPSDFGFEIVAIQRRTRNNGEVSTTTTIQTSISMLGAEEMLKNLVWEDYKGAEYRVRTYLIHFGSGNEVKYLVRPVRSRIRVPVGRRKANKLLNEGCRVDAYGYPVVRELRLPGTKDMKRFFEALGVGWKAFRMASSFPKKERTKPQRRINGPNPKAKAFTLNCSRSFDRKADAWKEAELDIKAGGYYIPIRHWKAQLPCHIHLEGAQRVESLNPGELFELLKGAEAVMGKSITVYGINKDTVLQRMEKEGNWINIWDFLLEAFWTFQNDARLDRIALYEAVKYHESAKLLNLLIQESAVLNYIPADHDGLIARATLAWDDLQDEVAELRKCYGGDWSRTQVVSPFIRFMEKFVWCTVPNRIKYTSIDTLWKSMNIPDLHEAYPLLEHLDVAYRWRSIHGRTVSMKFAEYIMQCDLVRSLSVSE